MPRLVKQCASCGLSYADTDEEFVMCGDFGRRYLKCVACYDLNKPRRTFSQLELFNPNNTVDY